MLDPSRCSLRAPVAALFAACVAHWRAVFVCAAAFSQLHGTPAAEPLDVSSFGAGPVAFITAHPDDIEGAAGGLVAQLTAQGTQVSYIILTNGDKGCGNPAICNDSITSEQIAVMRAQEALDAAKVLGVNASSVYLLDYEDAMLTSYPESEVRQRITALLRAIKPVATFSWQPYPNYGMIPSKGWYDLGFHPDHQASARLAIDAHSNSGTSRLWRESGQTWGIKGLYIFDFGQGFATPTHYLDITKNMGQKVEAFLVSASSSERGKRQELQQPSRTLCL